MLGVCFCLTAINVMDRQLLAILVEPVKLEFGVSDLAMGLLTGTAFAIFHALVGVPISRWADRGNRRSIIALGLFAWSALTVATGFAARFWQIFAARVGVGVGEAVGSGPAQSLLSDYFPPERRGLALSVHGSGGTLGALAGFALGGLLGELYGWRMTFVIFGLPGLLLAGVMWATVREPARDPGEPLDPLPEVARYLFGLPAFRQIAFAAALNAFASYALLSWNGSFLIRVHQLDLARAGLILGAGTALPTVLGMWAAGLVADRLGRRDARWYQWLPAAASLLCAPFFAFYLLLPNLWVATAMLVVASALNTVWLGLGNAMIQGLARPRMRAVAFAFVIVLNAGVGLGLGPPAAGALSDLWADRLGPESIRYALLVVVATYPWAAVHHLRAARTLREDLSRS
ncbi:MAG: MFS transporter [Proteobacteria bacterium]|nr:MFS transporter [Pseudomonadota bacterium]